MGLESLLGWGLLQMMLGPMSKPDEPMMRMRLWAWRACWAGAMFGGEDEIHVDVADDVDGAHEQT